MQTAISFFKKHGLQEAKKAYSLSVNAGHEDLELLQLIESHELVEFYGGIDKSHEFALSIWRLNKNDPFIENMKQAIADVESCQ